MKCLLEVPVYIVEFVAGFYFFFLNWSFVMKLTTKKSSGTLPRNVPEGTGTGTNNKKKFVQVLGHKTIQSAGQERFRMLLSDGK